MNHLITNLQRLDRVLSFGSLLKEKLGEPLHQALFCGKAVLRRFYDHLADVRTGCRKPKPESGDLLSLLIA